MNPRVEKHLRTGQFACLSEIRDEWEADRLAGEFGIFYAKIPKEDGELRKYRRAVLTKCSTIKKFRASIRQICEQAFLFWLNVFGWVFEPREQKVVIFNTYPFQDTMAIRLIESMGAK